MALDKNIHDGLKGNTAWGSPPGSSADGGRAETAVSLESLHVCDHGVAVSLTRRCLSEKLCSVDTRPVPQPALRSAHKRM